MAIYSLHHASIGRKTHDAGTAGAHMNYVTRRSACRAVIAEHMPENRAQVRAWLDEQEQADRANARVIDKIMLALPIELDQAQRVEAVRAFVSELAGGKPVPFFAAFHDKAGTKDADNPHAHVVLRDRDPVTGKRVIGMSEKGSTERAREVWERVCNAALASAKSSARIDRRSLKAQKIDRAPQGHEGPQPRHMEKKGKPSEKLARIRKSREEKRIAAELLKEEEARAQEEQEQWDLETCELLEGMDDFEVKAEALTPEKLAEKLEEVRAKTFDSFFVRDHRSPSIAKLSAKKEAEEKAWTEKKAAADRRQAETLDAVLRWKRAHFFRAFFHGLGVTSEELEGLEAAAEAAETRAKEAAEPYKFSEEWELRTLTEQAIMVAASEEDSAQREAARLEAVQRMRAGMTPEQIERRQEFAQTEEQMRADLLQRAIQAEERHKREMRAEREASSKPQPKPVPRSKPEPQAPSHTPDSGPSPDF